MFTHILLPTDGSEQCRKTVDSVLELARATGHRLAAYTCTKEFPNVAYSAGMGECPHAYYMETVQDYTKECIERIAGRTREEGMQFGSDVSQFIEPYLGILDAAKRHAYDVTFVTSHGHRSLMGRLLIGNETCKVLIYADVPVIVYR